MITRHWHTCDDEGGAQHTRDRDTAPAWSVPAFSSPLWQPGRLVDGRVTRHGHMCDTGLATTCPATGLQVVLARPGHQ